MGRQLLSLAFSTRTKPLRTSCTRLKKGSEKIRKTWLTKLQKHQQLPQISRGCQKHLQVTRPPCQEPQEASLFHRVVKTNQTKALTKLLLHHSNNNKQDLEVKQ